MKNIYRFRIPLIMFLCIALLLTYSCKKDEPKEIIKNITGQVQKGPFIVGTTISMSELKSTLEQTGKYFTSQIRSNSGTFEISNASLTSNYVELSADGYYYNEVKGEISTAPITLSAMADITNLSSVNVNILTHLEKLRVKYLVTQNNTFADAKRIAQEEILSLFGFSLSEMDNSESLDISVNSEGSAILLAISIILQGDRSVGDLSELLSNITNDLETDGTLNSESIITSLRNSTKDITLPSTIRSRLEKRYQDLGVEASIPNFEKYLNDFLVFTGQQPESSTKPATSLTTTGATLNGVVNPNSLSTSVTFEYGTTITYGNSTPATQSPIDGFSPLSVSIGITGLQPATIYHFRLKTENTKGITYTDDLTFTTLGNVPTATTQAAINIAITSATLKGTVNANYLSTNVTFEYGTTTSYGSIVAATPGPVTGNTNTSINASINGLNIGTTYHFRVKAENVLGNTYGNDITFTTLGQAPTAITQAPMIITTKSAELMGVVKDNNLETTVTFEYGTDTNYGNTIPALQNPITGNTYTTVTASINGLIVGTTYHFRVKAENVLGVTYGSDMQFTAKPAIGEEYAGGIVFYIDASGFHGLVCASTDQSLSSEWGCLGTEILGAEGKAIGTGNQNTTDIVIGCITEGIAARVCFDLSLNGYTDWFLPSKDELHLMRSQLYINGIGGFQNALYWSSSQAFDENPLYFACSENFLTNAQFTTVDKSYHACVRAIRAF